MTMTHFLSVMGFCKDSWSSLCILKTALSFSLGAGKLAGTSLGISVILLLAITFLADVRTATPAAVMIAVLKNFRRDCPSLRLVCLKFCLC
jgi:hypothetical protein